MRTKLLFCFSQKSARMQRWFWFYATVKIHFWHIIACLCYISGTTSLIYSIYWFAKCIIALCLDFGLFLTLLYNCNIAHIMQYYVWIFWFCILFKWFFSHFVTEWKNSLYSPSASMNHYTQHNNTQYLCCRRPGIVYVHWTMLYFAVSLTLALWKRAAF